MPWTLVPIALTFLLLAGTGLGDARSGAGVLPEGAATLAGCAALFSGYALFTAYERAAFGELAGGFWIPLLLLFALRDRRPAAGPAWRRAFDGSAAPLALVSPAPGCRMRRLGVMASYLLAAVALALALLRPLMGAAAARRRCHGLGLGPGRDLPVSAACEQTLGRSCARPRRPRLRVREQLALCAPR